MESILNRLINLMETTAPELWAIAMQQVQTMVASNAIWAGTLLVLLIACLAAFVYCNRALQSNDRLDYSDREAYQGGKWAAFGIGIVLFLVEMGILSDIIKYLMSPEYYAIRMLINLLPSQ